MIAEHAFRHFHVSAFQQAKSNQSVCGDGYFIEETERFLLGAVFDGLGSGEPARESAMEAIRVVSENIEASLEVMMHKINQSLSQYRGAVATLFKIDYQTSRFSYCAVGNIRFVLFPPIGKPIQPLPTYGFLSGRPINFKEEVFPYPENSVFVVHSDGLKSFTNLKSLLMDVPQISQHTCFRDRVNRLIQEDNDDITVLVGRPRDRFLNSPQ